MVLLFYVSPSSPQLQSRFKENAKILFKDSTTQENRQNLLFLLKTKKTTTLQQVTRGIIPNIVLKRMIELFLKILLVKKTYKMNFIN